MDSTRYSLVTPNEATDVNLDDVEPAGSQMARNSSDQESTEPLDYREMESTRHSLVTPDEAPDLNQDEVEPARSQMSRSSRDQESTEALGGTSSAQVEPSSGYIEPNGRPTITRRIATHLVYTAVASTVLLLLGIAFLGFLWFSNSTSALWQKIVLEDWLTRSITLSALALRTAISLQAGIATSMLASLIIEGAGVRLKDVPQISIMVFSDSQPHTLLWNYMKQVKSTGLTVLLVLLALSTLAIQSASTVLLSDVTLDLTLALPSNETVFYGFKDVSSSRNLVSDTLHDTKYWMQMMTQYPTFGEYSDPPDKKDGIDDTGTVIRSLLPINDTARARLKNYKGPAFVFDARTVCVQPNFRSIQITNDGAGVLLGEVAPRHGIDNLVIDSSYQSFRCQLPLHSCEQKPEKTCRERYSSWSLCHLRPEAGGLISALDPTNNMSLQHTLLLGYPVATNGQNTWAYELGKAYLLLNATAGSFDGIDNFNHTYIDTPWATFPVSTDKMGDYADYASSWKASLCYNALPPSQYKQFQDFEVTVTSEGMRKEPVLRTPRQFEDSENPTTIELDTSDILRQAGVYPTHASMTERGVFDLSRKELHEAITNAKNQFSPNDNLTTKLEDIDGDVLRNNLNTYRQFGQTATASWIIDVAVPSRTIYEVYLICRACVQAVDSTPVSPFLAAVFDDALQRTGSPALALQAYFTSVLRSAYYTWLPFFDVQANTTTTSYVERSVPVSSRGFWAVMAIIATHIIVCTFTTAAFMNKTHFSFLGNVWAVFAQVVHSDDAQPVLQEATRQTDKEIEHTLKKDNGGLRKRYRLTLLEEDAIVAFTASPKCDSEE